MRLIAPWEAPSLRQRLIAGAIVILLVAGTGPVLGHHLPFGVGGGVEGFDHIAGLCVAALYLLLRPVHWSFHVVLFGGLLYALADRLMAWRRLQRAVAPLASHGPARGDPLVAAARQAGLDPERLRLVPGLPNPVFTAGLLRPVVFLAPEVSARLERAELVAVLAHEAAHVRRRDPLRLMVLRALAHAFFWMPVIRGLADDFADDAELLADDFAVGQAGPLPVASALLSLSAWGTDSLHAHGVVGFGGAALVTRRIRRLLGESSPATTHVSRRTVVSAVAALSLVWAAGLVMAHPLPGGEAGIGGREPHCLHPHGAAVAHLFCKARHDFARTCPHQRDPAAAGLAAAGLAAAGLAPR